MKLKFDKPLIAILLSILGALPVGIFSELMKFFHLTTITAPEMTSMMFIREGSISLGILSHLGYSAILGLALYYSPKILGIDYFLIKAMFISMFFEALLYIVFGTFTRNEYMMQDAVGNYALSSAAAIGGLTRGFLIKKYLFNFKKNINNVRQYLYEGTKDRQKQRMFRISPQPARKIEKSKRKVKFIKPKKL